MLSTDQRELLLDALRPPQGYRLDRGIGTTFTLDLLTLLIAPLSMAFLEVADTAQALENPLLLLEALRRCANRITVFCQAGRIAIPPPDNLLYSFLEKSVVQVRAPYGGVFHPKTWLLRYLPEADGARPIYRLLNLSRNLTFERSWDLILRLEGQLMPEHRNAFGRNNPLGDFIQMLPRLAKDPPEQRILQDVDLLQSEVRRVAFQAPAPFENELTFYPSGIPGYNRGYRFDNKSQRALVVSPFLSTGLLQRITASGAGHVLISRANSLATLDPATLASFECVYVLDDAATVEPESAASGDASVAGTGEEVAGIEHEPSGLHAKLYVLEAGWDATWLVGSANATEAAFQRANVEFMVALRGRKARVGIDRVLGTEGDEGALLPLLRTYLPGERAAVDEEQKAVQELAERVRKWLVNEEMRLKVVPQGADRFDLVLHRRSAKGLAPQGEYAIACWPITLPSLRGVPFDPRAGSLRFADLALLTLTSFIAFSLSVRSGALEHKLCFVLNLPIDGLPEERQDSLYSAVITDRSQFLHYLWIMLMGDEASRLGWLDLVGQGLESRGRWDTHEGDLPLLEALVRALSRSPEKIDRVAELVEGLQRTATGRDVLPEGFALLWQAIMQARSEVR